MQDDIPLKSMPSFICLTALLLQIIKESFIELFERTPEHIG